MSDSDAYLLNESQMLLLCMKADAKEAARADDFRAEIIEVVRAWARGSLLPEHKAPLLSALYSRGRTLDDWRGG
jgi:hypothetical protein